MRLIILLIIVPLIAAAPKLCSAEGEPTPSSSTEIPEATAPEAPTQTPIQLAEAPTEHKDQDLASLELELAETGFKINPTYSNRLRLILAYERSINRVCMRNLLDSLSYGGSPTDQVCKDLIEKVFILDNRNPAGICARDGIDSSSCRDAYQSQGLGLIRSDPDSGDLDAILDSKKDSARNQSLQQAANKLYTESSINKDPSAKVRALQIMATLLQENCQMIRLNIPENILLSSATPTPFGQVVLPGGEVITALPDTIPLAPIILTPTPRPFDAMLKEIAKSRNATTEKVTETRWRLVSEKCKGFIDSTLRWDPENSTAICFSSGFYSPRCIQAKRNDRQNVGKTAPGPKSTPKTPEGGLAHF